MYRLLQGDTVEAALDFAKSVWGVDDITYATVQTSWTSVKPAEENASTEIYCGKDEILVTLTQVQKEAYTWHLEPSIDADFVGVVKQGTRFPVFMMRNTINMIQIGIVLIAAMAKTESSD